MMKKYKITFHPKGRDIPRGEKYEDLVVATTALAAENKFKKRYGKWNTIDTVRVIK